MGIAIQSAHGYPTSDRGCWLLVVVVVVVAVVVVVLVVVVVVARSLSVLRLALWKYLAPIGCPKDCIVDLPSPDWANLQILYTR